MASDKDLWAYTAAGRICVPAQQFTTLPPGHVAQALRGFGHIRAVLVDGQCVGWCFPEALTVKGELTFDLRPALTWALMDPDFKEDPAAHVRARRARLFNLRMCRDLGWSPHLKA